MAAVAASRPALSVRSRLVSSESCRSPLAVRRNDLADKIRKATGYAAKVEFASSGNNRMLRISPSQTTSTVEILPGKGGTDAGPA